MAAEPEPAPHLRPLRPADAKPLFRRIVELGDFAVSAHAVAEMKKDGLATPDCLNVLRGGVVEPAELINGEWRYRVATNRMCVVVTIVASLRLRVVTAWRTSE